MKKIMILLFVIINYNIFAEYKDIPVTRDLNPNAVYDTYQDWKANHPNQQTIFQEVSRTSSVQRDEGFLIVVNDELYEEIEGSIQTYQADLNEDGYNTFVLEWDGTSHFDLKIEIIIYNQLENVTNVALVGDLPTAWFELFEDWNNNGVQDDDEAWVEFPCDLYFTDLDGSWEDTDSNGIYDIHESEVQPEISIGRIIANNMLMLPDSEAELVNDYFQRNHLFRSGIITSYETSLAYVDDDWAYWGQQYQQAMQLAYPSVDLVNNEEETLASDYRDNRLVADYEFIQVHVHSGPNAHYFYYNNGNNYELVNNYEIEGINPTAHFYNLFCCSNSRFTTYDNMGGMYIYGSDHGLATIGSTKTGSMLGFSDFYQPFSEDLPIGEALRLWWIENVDTGPDWRWERAWFYGMIVQGDPSLQRAYEQGDVIYIPQNFPTIQEGIDAASNGYIIFVDDGYYYENLNINNKNIILQSINGAENCIIDGNGNDTVISINNLDDLELRGFTITNGQSQSYGSGINCIDASPRLYNLKIENNHFANWGIGGGINFLNSEAILQDIDFNNNSAQFGGAIHAEDSIIEMTNIICSENESFWGGAICMLNAEATIYNALFKNNYSPNEGGAIWTDRSELNLINATFYGNSANSYGGGIYLIWSSYINLINCVFLENYPEDICFTYDGYYPYSTMNIAFCNFGNGEDGIVTNNNGFLNMLQGNNYEDPEFISLDDFHLDDNSPCIGSGIDEIEINGNIYFSPEFDLEGNNRPAPDDSMPDIGAYENPLGSPIVGSENYELPVTSCELSNFPNPFNPSTTITFSISETGFADAKIEIMNIKGQKVKSLPINNISQSAERQVVWDGTDDIEKPVSSGVYFYNLKIDNKIVSSKKMLLIK